jgi:hypothetical protein
MWRLPELLGVVGELIGVGEGKKEWKHEESVFENQIIMVIL